MRERKVKRERGRGEERERERQTVGEAGSQTGKMPEH